jgi:hypothetical protein
MPFRDYSSLMVDRDLPTRKYSLEISFDPTDTPSVNLQGQGHDKPVIRIRVYTERILQKIKNNVTQ